MLQDVQRKEIDELYKTSIVQQTAFWSIVKRKVGWQSMALNFKSYNSQLFHNVSNDRAITSDLLVIIQQINHTDSIAYVPYGPELESFPQKESQRVFKQTNTNCMN